MKASLFSRTLLETYSELNWRFKCYGAQPTQRFSLRSTRPGLYVLGVFFTVFSYKHSLVMHCNEIAYLLVPTLESHIVQIPRYNQRRLISGGLEPWDWCSCEPSLYRWRLARAAHTSVHALQWSNPHRTGKTTVRGCRWYKQKSQSRSLIIV